MTKDLDPLLRVRMTGPGVRRGRILLADLVRFGRHLQTALDRVGRVLASDGAGEPTGRKPTRSCFALEVVALARGSFQLGLDLPREQKELPGLDPGEVALETLIGGLDGVKGGAQVLPRGYDPGVLAAWREAGSIFGHGVEAIEFHLRTATVPTRATFDVRAHRRVVERIQAPVHNRRTVEGRLLMADFKSARLRCRIHPSVGSAVDCDFDESLAEAVYDHLRAFVRVTGEATEDPETGAIRRLTIADIEPLEIETDAEPIAPDEFWREPTIAELAAEQGIDAPQALDRMIGAAADLWDNDDDVEVFVAGVEARRREGRERQEPST